MTLMDFFGNAFLAFGPPLAMVVLTIAIEPIRIIILIASSFFWLSSLLVSSIVWFAIVPLRPYLSIGLVYSVIFQEIFRYFLYTVLRKVENSLEKVTTAHVADSRHVFAYVCGLGFGLMSGAFALFNVLADSVGPGTMGLHHGNEFFFLISSSTTLSFILLHTFWGVIFFSALDNKNWGQIAWVICSHLFVSAMTLLNGIGYHAISLSSAYVVLLITMVIAFTVAGGKTQNLISCFIKK